MDFILDGFYSRWDILAQMGVSIGYLFGDWRLNTGAE